MTDVSETLDKLRNGLEVISENFYGAKYPAYISAVGLISGVNVLLYGQEGTGKTELATQVASLVYSMPTEIIRSSTLQGGLTNPTTIFGSVDIKKLKEGNYETKVRNMPFIYIGRIIDEINRADEETQNILLPLLDGRKMLYVNGQLFQLPGENESYIATANIEGIGTHPVSSQLMDRFIGIFMYPKLQTNIELENGKRKTLEDLLGDGEDKELIKEFRESYYDKNAVIELRRKFAKEYGTISPDELKRLRKEIWNLNIKEEHYLPLAYTRAILAVTDIKHYSTLGLSYIKPLNLGPRIEEKMKRLISTYLIMKGWSPNEENVEKAIFNLLSYVISQKVTPSEKGREYISDKRQSMELLPGYTSEEGIKFYLAKIVSKRIKEEYNKIKEYLKENILAVITEKVDARDIDDPLIKALIMERREENEW